jgi:hypothetical protein
MNLGAPDAWDSHMKNRCDKARVQFFELFRKGLTWDGDSLPTAVFYFRNITQTIIKYGAEIWEHTKSQIQQMNKLQATLLKLLLDLHPATPTFWVLWSVDCLPADLLLDQTVLTAWRVWSKKDEPPSEYVHRITRKALKGCGLKTDHSMMRPKYKFPTKEQWAARVNTWVNKEYLNRYNKWNNQTGKRSPKQTYRKTTDHPIREMAPVFKANLTIFLRMQAYALGFPGDSTRHGAPSTCKCVGCNKNALDTPIHAMLSCEAYRHARNMTLNKQIEKLNPQKKKEWDALNHDQEAQWMFIVELKSQEVSKAATELMKNILMSRDMPTTRARQL